MAILCPENMFYAQFLIILSVCFVTGTALISWQDDRTRENEICMQRKTHYKASVVEYKPIPIGNQTPEEALLSNVRVYVQLIQEAGNQNVDIIVFPEYGITTIALPPQREVAREFFVEIPKYGTIPCENETKYTGKSELSCAAIQSKLYIVVNLGEVEYCDFNTDSSCPSDGGYHYNTNVVFDRNGAIISRYRKLHLYFEPQFNYPALEYSTFNTDFGVEFGLFTCFDIIFAHPAVDLVANRAIRNFAFPTAWIDELPFLTAIQSQALWAQSNQANLLASGYHQPDRGSMGSGIYSGDEGALNYVFDPSSGTKLVTSLVPITSSNTTSYFNPFQQPTQSASQDPSLEPYHMWLREDLTNCSHIPIDPYSNHEFLCHENIFCCNIEYNLNSTSYSGNLKLLVFDGRRTVAAKRDWFEWQVCAILHCLNDTLESCTESSYESTDHPKFNFIKIQVQPLKVEYGDEETSASQPGLSLLDTKFRLIPQSQFKIRRWRDSTTGNMNAEVETTGSSEISHFQIKTVALIQKVYGGRL